MPAVHLSLVFMPDMSEKKSPPQKERSGLLRTPQAESKAFKRKLLSPEHTEDEDKKVTPKRKRPLGFDISSPDPGNSSSPRGGSGNVSRLSVPLSERQQMALLMRMTDESSQGDSSPKPSSPPPSVTSTKRTQADKKVNKRNERGETPLHLAAKRGDVKQAKKLIKAGASVNVTDYAGWTPLHEACNLGNVGVAKALLKSGANVNVLGLGDESPLHDAATNNNSKLVGILLRHGANPLQANVKGETPVDVAKDVNIKKLLGREIISSNSESSSVDEIRSPTSPESLSSIKDEDRGIDVEDIKPRSASMSMVRADNSCPPGSIAGNRRMSLPPKSPVDKALPSPRLFLKFKSAGSSSREEGGPNQGLSSRKSTDSKEPLFKSYTLTMDTGDQQQPPPSQQQQHLHHLHPNYGQHRGGPGGRGGGSNLRASPACSPPPPSLSSSMEVDLQGSSASGHTSMSDHHHHLSHHNQHHNKHKVDPWDSIVVSGGGVSSGDSSAGVGGSQNNVSSMPSSLSSSSTASVLSSSTTFSSSGLPSLKVQCVRPADSSEEESVGRPSSHQPSLQRMRTEPFTPSSSSRVVEEVSDDDGFEEEERGVRLLPRGGGVYHHSHPHSQHHSNLVGPPRLSPNIVGGGSGVGSGSGSRSNSQQQHIPAMDGSSGVINHGATATTTTTTSSSSSLFSSSSSFASSTNKHRTGHPSSASGVSPASLSSSSSSSSAMMDVTSVCVSRTSSVTSTTGSGGVSSATSTEKDTSSSSSNLGGGGVAERTSQLPPFGSRRSSGGGGSSGVGVGAGSISCVNSAGGVGVISTGAGGGSVSQTNAIGSSSGGGSSSSVGGSGLTPQLRWDTRSRTEQRAGGGAGDRSSPKAPFLHPPPSSLVADPFSSLAVSAEKSDSSASSPLVLHMDVDENIPSPRSERGENNSNSSESRPPSVTPSSSCPKVPPLKIILPSQKMSAATHHTSQDQSKHSHHQANKPALLPYVLNPTQVPGGGAGGEWAASEAAAAQDPKNEGARVPEPSASALEEDLHVSTPSPSPRPSRPSSRAGSSDRDENRNLSSRSQTLDSSPLARGGDETAGGNESREDEDGGGAAGDGSRSSGGGEGSGGERGGNEEARPTRTLRSHTMKQQQQGGAGSGGAGGGTGSGTKEPKQQKGGGEKASGRVEVVKLEMQEKGSKADQKEFSDGKEDVDTTTDSGTPQQEELHIHPRKRKLRAKTEAQSREQAENRGVVLEKPPNPYELYLNLRRQQMRNRHKMMCSVTPKPPTGFKDYLMVNCTYVLQGNTTSTLSVPMLTPPNSVTGPMRDLFLEQEKARYRLRLQHHIEREKLMLAIEQEILREHARAARAVANQNQPLSVCTILCEEEIYNLQELEQAEDRDKSSRSRYNGRQFLSWLQDVGDKYDNIKTLLLMRHHHEAESLRAVQKMDWEWKLKECGQCDFKTTPLIDEVHLPMVQVNDEFELLPPQRLRPL